MSARSMEYPAFRMQRFVENGAYIPMNLFLMMRDGLHRVEVITRIDQVDGQGRTLFQVGSKRTMLREVIRKYGLGKDN